jgi:SEC-C motif-containing protein
MRARYSAYALGEIDFLLATGADADRAGITAFAQRARFVRLRVEATESGGPADTAGTVSFAAQFVEAGRLQELRERSRFGRRDGRWQYLDGDARVELLAMGRNDSCPCGSGRKFKKCHGG